MKNADGSNRFKFNKWAIVFLAIISFILTVPGISHAIRAQSERLADEGIKLFNLGKLPEAESKLKAAIEEDGSYDKPYFYMAQIFARQNKYDESVRHVKMALKNSPHEEVYKSFLCDVNNLMAMDALKNNNQDRAYKIYFSNIETLPYHTPTYNRLAALAIQKKDYNNALLQCNKALENASSAPPTLKFDVEESAILKANMAICFFELKNYSRAIAEIEAAKKCKDSQYVQKFYKRIISDENPIFAELKKAEAAFAAGDLENAKNGFEKVLSLYPGSTASAEKLAIIERHRKIESVISEADKLAKESRFNEAIEKYNEVLALEPTRTVISAKIKELEQHLDKQQKEALASMRKNRPDKQANPAEVDQKLKALIEKAQVSNDPNVIYEQKFREAEEYYSKEKYDEALGIYKSLSEDREDFKTDEVTKRIKSIHAQRGELYIDYFKTGVPKLYIYLTIIAVVGLIIWMYAGAQLSVMFKADPQRFYKKGVELLDKEKYDQAVLSFEKALTTVHDPIERTRIKAKLALCYFKSKNFDKCIKVSTEVLDVDPKNEVVHGYLGNSYLEKNVQNERAFNEYKLLLKKQKDDKRLLTILCTQFLQEDNLSQEAIDVYQKVYALDPSDKRVRKMLCEAFVRTNDKSDLAIKIYESVLVDETHRKEVKLMLISAQFHRKNFQECIKLCRELFDTGAFESITLEYYTNSFSKLNRKGELYDEYKNYSAKFPDNQILKSYLDKVQSLLMVERLTGPGGGSGSVAYDMPSDGGAQQAPLERPKMTAAAPAVNICKNCAHMNPGSAKTCEKCAAAL